MTKRKLKNILNTLESFEKDFKAFYNINKDLRNGPDLVDIITNLRDTKFAISRILFRISREP